MLSWQPRWPPHEQRIRAKEDILKTGGRRKSGLGRALQRLGHDQLDVAAADETRCGAEIRRTPSVYDVPWKRSLIGSHA